MKLRFILRICRLKYNKLYRFSTERRRRVPSLGNWGQTPEAFARDPDGDSPSAQPALEHASGKRGKVVVEQPSNL